MARRRLEAALQAGKAMERGKEVTEFFYHVREMFTYPVEEQQDGVYSLQYSPDADYLAVGFGDSSIHVLSAQSGELVMEVSKHKYGGMPITCLRFHPKEHHIFLATSAEGKVLACSRIDGSHEMVASEPGNQISCLDFNLEGTTYVTGGKDTDVRIYDAATNKLVKTYEGFHYDSAKQNEKCHGQRIFATKFHPDHASVLVSGGWDNHLKVWDYRTNEGVIRTIPGPHICGDSIDIKGPYILTGSWVAQDALQAWNFSDGRLLHTIPFPNDGNGEFLYCAQFGEKSNALAGGSGTNSVKAINLKTQQILGEIKLDYPVQAMDSIRGGRFFAVGGSGNVLKMACMK